MTVQIRANYLEIWPPIRIIFEAFAHNCAYFRFHILRNKGAWIQFTTSNSRGNTEGIGVGRERHLMRVNFNQGDACKSKQYSLGKEEEELRKYFQLVRSDNVPLNFKDFSFG